MSPDRIVIGEVRGGEALDLLDAMNTGHPGSICTLHADSPRETLPRLVRLAMRNPQAPRAEVVRAEVVSTVDLILFVGFARVGAGCRRSRRLLSIGCIAGADGDRPVVNELIGLGGDGCWHRAGSLTAMSDRARSRLGQVADVERLLDGFDA